MQRFFSCRFDGLGIDIKVGKFNGTLFIGIMGNKTEIAVRKVVIIIGIICEVRSINPKTEVIAIDNYCQLIYVVPVPYDVRQLFAPSS